jgi:hypothetical protein
LGDLIVCTEDAFEADSDAKLRISDLAWLEFRRTVGLEVQKHETRPETTEAAEPDALTLSSQLKAFTKWIDHFLRVSAVSDMEFTSVVGGIITLVKRGLGDSSHFVQSEAVSLLARLGLNTSPELSSLLPDQAETVLNFIVDAIMELRAQMEQDAETPGIGAPTLLLQFIDACLDLNCLKPLKYTELCSICWTLCFDDASLVAQRARDVVERIVSARNAEAIALLLDEDADPCEESRSYCSHFLVVSSEHARRLTNLLVQW